MSIERVRETLALRVRLSRYRRDWNQRQVADRVGCALSHISRIELGRSVPSLRTLVALADALGVSVAYLVGEVDTPRRDFADRLPTRLSDKPPVAVRLTTERRTERAGARSER